MNFSFIPRSTSCGRNRTVPRPLVAASLPILVAAMCVGAGWVQPPQAHAVSEIISTPPLGLDNEGPADPPPADPPPAAAPAPAPDPGTAGPRRSSGSDRSPTGPISITKPRTTVSCQPAANLVGVVTAPATAIQSGISAAPATTTPTTAPTTSAPTAAPTNTNTERLPPAIADVERQRRRPPGRERRRHQRQRPPGARIGGTGVNASDGDPGESATRRAPRGNPGNPGGGGTGPAQASAVGPNVTVPTAGPAEVPRQPVGPVGDFAPPTRDFAVVLMSSVGSGFSAVIIILILLTIGVWYFGHRVAVQLTTVEGRNA